MPVTGPFAELGRQRALLKGIASGDTGRSIGNCAAHHGVRVGGEGLGRQGVASRTALAPSQGGASGGLSLSGGCVRRCGVETRANASRFTDRAQAASGQFYGGTHQYGPDHPAKGLMPMRLAHADRALALGDEGGASRPDQSCRGPESCLTRWAEAFEAVVHEQMDQTTKG